MTLNTLKLLIIGYGPAAVSALRAIASCREAGAKQDVAVTIVTPELHPPYSPMFLIEYVFGNIKRRQFYLPPLPKDGVSLHTIAGRKVVAIRPKDSRVLLDNRKSLAYDHLLIATGASALKPPIKGLDKPGVFFVNRLDEARRLRERVKQASRIIIVGAGAIGIETALALTAQGKSVTIMEALGQIVPLMLDEDLAGYLQGKLKQRGISFCLNSPVSEVTGKRRAEGVVAKGQTIVGDLVIVAAGFRPNTAFLNSKDIKTARGVLVDDRMQTSVPNVFAAGDVAEARNPFSDQYELNFTWYSAVEQGWVAGCNMVGGNKRLLYSPSLNVLKGLDFTAASVGQKVQGNGCEVLSYRDERAGILEKIYLKGNYIEHYQSIGLPYKVGYVYNLVKNRKNIYHLKRYLTITTPEASSPIYLT